ncbi:MAG: IPT/TIG domain-containing protein [Bacteroidales bacterium]|nr:IPT/TIG domain-containing protein [Bacteroidales bacterium]
MKKIFKYFGIFLSVAMMGVFTSCNIEEITESADLGLGIKVFFPTKVVAGQPMTINGSGFSDVREIVFPNGVTVSNFEIVSDDMIRVTAPSGIAAAGGNLIVRTADEEAESRLPLTLGSTAISGYSKQEGESIKGGEQLTIYGKDLEFISSVELLDPDGNPLILQDEDFYRKGTSMVIITLPGKVFEGSFAGKVYTFDGREFLMPELAYEPASDGGHWETVKTTIWKNEGGPAVSWSGTYRFALEGHDGNNECIAEIPQDIWNKMMTETFYIDIQATDPQVRVTTGWWDPNWMAGDIQPGNELLTDNGDGTWTVEINLTDNPDFVAALVDRHLLFTGDRYTPVEIYFKEDIWVDGGGHMEIVKTDIWKNEGSPAVSWSGTYRFALEGHDFNNECIAEIPQDIWDKMMTETFYIDIQATDPQVRVTTGWWDPSWKVGDIQPGNELLTDNGDGTWTVAINLTDDPDFVAALIDRHLLFTGDRYTPIEIYFMEEIWVDGGDDQPKEDVFWENGGSGAVSWNGTYRFALEGHDYNNECIGEFPQDIWDKIKTKTFYLVVESSDPQVRVTTGWWDPSWKVGDIQPGNELITDNGDGTWTVEINISDDADFLAALDERHLLFTGDRYIPLKLYFK